MARPMYPEVTPDSEAVPVDNYDYDENDPAPRLLTAHKPAVSVTYREEGDKLDRAIALTRRALRLATQLDYENTSYETRELLATLTVQLHAHQIERRARRNQKIDTRRETLRIYVDAARKAADEYHNGL